jgi:transcriptional regulator with XRE-family HTH domain
MQTTTETLETLKFNIERLMISRSLNRAQLSREAGYRNANKVTTVLNGSSMPNIDFAVRVAQAFEVEIGELFRKREELKDSEISVQPVEFVERKATNLLNSIFQSAHRKLVEMGERPTMDLIASWWQENGGRLEACDGIAPHFDLIAVPDPGQRLPEVERVGYKSLTAHALNSNDNSRMMQFIRTLNEADLDDLHKCIRTVSYSGMGMITPQTRIVDLPNMDSPLKISFLRLMLPVTDEDGKAHVLNFSTLMSESSASSRSGFLQ